MENYVNSASSQYIAQTESHFKGPTPISITSCLTGSRVLLRTNWLAVALVQPAFDVGMCWHDSLVIPIMALWSHSCKVWVLINKCSCTKLSSPSLSPNKITFYSAPHPHSAWVWEDLVPFIIGIYEDLRCLSHAQKMRAGPLIWTLLVAACTVMVHAGHRWFPSLRLLPDSVTHETGLFLSLNPRI